MSASSNAKRLVIVLETKESNSFQPRVSNIAELFVSLVNPCSYSAAARSEQRRA
jgi:hypothetical protein